MKSACVLPAHLRAVLVLACMALTWRRCGVFTSTERLMQDSLAVNPASWTAHTNLAAELAALGRPQEAIAHYEEALRLLPGADTLRLVSVEVCDSDAWPFIRHHAWRRSEDVPAALIAETAAKQREQALRAVAAPLDEMALRGFCTAYCSSLVHDVNAVHGLLDGMGLATAGIAGAQLFAGGEGGHGSVRLAGGRALWTMTHLAVPGLPDYRERISLYFDDRTLELEFPSPWLNHQPTRLTLRRGDGHRLHVEHVRSGYEEAFVEELKGFAAAIAGEAPVRNTAEQASRDMELLCGLARWHAAHPPQPIKSGALS